MQPNYLAVSGLFSQPERYAVPLFQRPYVWTEEEQWRPLWNDIQRVCEALKDDPKNVRPHFLGSVVLDQRRTPAGHLASREIIDGQQRLTTLQLFLKAAADAAAKTKAASAAGQLADLIKNRHVPDDDPFGRFKVWPTESDQPAYAAVMDAMGDQIPDGYSQHRFAQAYQFFRSSISAWLGTKSTVAETRAGDLSNALHHHIKLMTLDIDPNEDAQVIFETLNARGTPLLPIDLVKNWLLREARRKEAEPRALYNTHWKQTFDDQIEYWREEVGRGHAQRPRADLFFQNFLTVRQRDEISSDHLYYQFLRDVERSKETIAARFAMLERYAQVFREIDEPDEDTPVGRRLARLKELDFVTVYPFLMALRSEADDSELLEVLKIVESFLVRRLICGLNTRGYGRLFIDLMATAIHRKPAQRPRDGVIEFLNHSDAEASRWPNDEELRKAWMDLPLYSRISQPRVRFILASLEEFMRTENGLTEPFALPARLEIEHIMPQSWQANWPLRQGERHDGNAAQRRENLLHTVGNLTLVTRKLNATLSNAPWSISTKDAPAKRKTLREYSLMMLSKSIFDQPKWNEDHINARGEMLLMHAQEIWPPAPATRSHK